jgi:hypothetical protein
MSVLAEVPVLNIEAPPAVIPELAVSAPVTVAAASVAVAKAAFPLFAMLHAVAVSVEFLPLTAKLVVLSGGTILAAVRPAVGLMVMPLRLTRSCCVCVKANVDSKHSASRYLMLILGFWVRARI